MKINSINGPLDTSELGMTLMHEHILNVYNDMRIAFDDWVDLDEVKRNFCIEVAKAKAFGVKTIVDCTPINLGRDIHFIQECAAAADVQMVVSTGLYNMEKPWTPSNPKFADARYMADLFLREINDGIQKSGIKPAVIKCATDSSTGITEINRQMLKAAALASKESGLPIYTHTTPGDGVMGIYQQEVFLDECGLEPHKVIIGHSFDSVNGEYVEKLLQRGTYVGCDRVGLDIVRPLEQIADCLIPILKKGYAKQIILSHDNTICNDCAFSFSTIKRTEKNPTVVGYSAVFDRLIPILLANGIPQADIDTILYENPKRYFDGTPIPKN